MTFWAVLGGVLGANLLTVSFVWGAYAYSKHERAGTAGSRESHWAAVAVVAPLVVLAVATGAALQTAPKWIGKAITGEWTDLGNEVRIRQID